MRSVETNSLFKRTLLLAILVAFSAFLFLEFTNGEESKLSTSLKLVGSQKVEISALIKGDWDFACVISETARPETVALQVAPKSPKFEDVGNRNRSMLFDGESGLVLVSNVRGTYALYLVFRDSMAAIIHNDGPQCLPFQRALLVERLKEDDWRYFELIDCGDC